MTNFCTLFNTNYLTRGLALFSSLAQQCDDFRLYVVCFDSDCYDYLTSLEEPRLHAISLKDFEDSQLLHVKPTRTATEYCWTCTPSIIKYCIETFSLSACIYLDSDLFFYHSPLLLLEEAPDKPVLITEHNYAREYDQAATHGRFCVQFIYIRNCLQGMSILNRWRNQCIQWCYAYLENEKFGDQKYLDEWPLLYPDAVHISTLPGAGAAPWNISKFNVTKIDGKPYLEDKNHRLAPLVFFHFHHLKFYTNQRVQYTGAFYSISAVVKDLIYKPYIENLITQGKRIHWNKKLNFHGNSGESPSLANYIYSYSKILVFNLLKGNRKIINPQFGVLKNHLHIHKLT